MASRLFDRELRCGCLISSDGGGGCIPCCYGYGCGKNFELNGKIVECNEEHECLECREQAKLCEESWAAWRKTYDFKLHTRECIERNNSDVYLSQMIQEDSDVRRLFEETGGLPNYLGDVD